ncbi:hypothetical protein JQC92_11260 [Shewanella sp. 202IG2-18]|uniref:hypothetical protein n=1 Tax=Parashewanella hymeniacidonis TaxID=2807618 RepID=UPI00195FA635|nr:hypothetical protein [Parashewanella hymeniacidonis]MBM7072598.1 hypothetical protein [Parashewanella hymeniacidonis]
MDGKNLSDILSSEFQSTHASRVEVTGDDGNIKQLASTSVSSSIRCKASEKLKSLKIQAKIFAGVDRRKPIEPCALFTDSDDHLIISIVDSSLDFKFLDFRIRTVICHIGSRSVNSGHYFTLENLGDQRWLVHSDRSIKFYKGNLKAYFTHNFSTLPYLSDLEKNVDELTDY